MTGNPSRTLKSDLPFSSPIRNLYNKRELDRWFGARLRRLRAVSGMTRYKLSNCSGVPAGSIRHMEEGARSCNIRTACNLAQALGLTITTLLE